jgi:hypothetical protein
VLRYCVAAILLSTGASLAQAASNLSGTWSFTQANSRFQGTILLRQAGTDLTGTWHTTKGKVEPDTSVAGRVDGMTVVLSRYIGDNQQNYVLTLSADANRLDGFGDGWFVKHTNLNMERVAARASSAKTARARTPLARTRAAQASSVQPPLLSRQSTAATAASRQATPATQQKWMGISLPPPRGTWTWVIQSVVVRGTSGRKYSSFYYEAATGRSVEQPLSLPAGGEIVGVFPDDCAFSMQDESRHSLMFRNADEARAKGLGPGTWSVYPLKCGGIAVYVK